MPAFDSATPEWKAAGFSNETDFDASVYMGWHRARQPRQPTYRAWTRHYTRSDWSFNIPNIRTRYRSLLKWPKGGSPASARKVLRRNIQDEVNRFRENPRLTYFCDKIDSDFPAGTPTSPNWLIDALMHGRPAVYVDPAHYCQALLTITIEINRGSPVERVAVEWLDCIRPYNAAGMRLLAELRQPLTMAAE